MYMELAKIYYIKKKKLNVTKLYNNTKMINFYNVARENIKEHNPNWPQIYDHPFGEYLEKQMHYLI